MARAARLSPIPRRPLLAQRCQHRTSVPDANQARAALIKLGHTFHAMFQRQRRHFEPRGREHINFQVKRPHQGRERAAERNPALHILVQAPS